MVSHRVQRRQPPSKQSKVVTPKNQLELRYPWARPDVRTGLISSVAVVPIAISLAWLAGATLQAGLWAGVAGFTVCALAGRSPILGAGATLAVASLTLDAVSRSGASPAGAASIAATFGLVSGASLVVVSKVHLGFLSRVISRPVFAGFRVGIAAWVSARLFGSLLGLRADSTSFFGNLRDLVRESSSVDLLTVVFSLFCLGIVALAHRTRLKVSWPLLPLVAGVGAYLIGLGGDGLAMTSAIHRGLPDLTLPTFGETEALWPALLCLPLLILIESTSTARDLERPNSVRARVEHEARVLALANLGSAVLGGLPASAEPPQQSMLAESGSQTRNSRLIVALVLVTFLVILGALSGKIPEASLSLVAVVLAAKSVPLHELAVTGRDKRKELALVSSGVAAVLVFGPLSGLLVAAGISMLQLFYELNRPRVGRVEIAPPSAEKANGQTPAGHDGETIVLSITGPVYFANAEEVVEEILEKVDRTRGPLGPVIIDGSNLSAADDEAIKELVLAVEHLQARSIAVALAGFNGRLGDRLPGLPASLHAVPVFRNWKDAQRSFVKARNRRMRVKTIRTLAEASPESGPGLLIEDAATR
jgi:SulP family sulfate permease